MASAESELGLQVINWKMATHPVNYITILVMLVLAGIFGASVMAFLGFEPATSNETN